jgi:hypothetical protein
MRIRGVQKHTDPPDPDHWYAVHFHHSSKIKSQKEVTKQLKSRFGFSYYFSLMMEGSGAESVLVTNGYENGSGRPKNIRIRMRIGIPNIVVKRLKECMCGAWVAARR